MQMYLVEETDHDRNGKTRLVYVQTTTDNRTTGTASEEKMESPPPSAMAET